MTRARRMDAARFLVPLVVAAVAVVVLSTMLEGRPRVTPLAVTTPRPLRLTPFPRPSAGVGHFAPDPLGAALNAAVGTILLVLAGVLVIGLLLLLIRLLVSAARSWRRRSRPRSIDASGAVDDLQLADAPEVLRGIAAAIAAFDEHREPTDAVVRAWLGLQQAAEDAGFARPPAETPTEFTRRVLSRSSADRGALERLLRLYLHARFGGSPITATDAGDALDALRALQASWGAAPVAGRG